MPVPRSRSAVATAEGLRRWATDALGPAGVQVRLLPGPKASGFSCETVLFDVVWPGSERPCVAELAARVHPSGYSLFQEHDLERQWQLIDAVWHDGRVPVPRVVGQAPDGNDYLGLPFFVMQRIAGEPCADSPPYSMRGWLKDADPASQRSVVEQSIDLLAAVHSIPTEHLPGSIHRGVPPGIRAQISSYRQFLDWVCAGRGVPRFEEAYEWLAGHVPFHEDRTFCWGDARLGNILFESGRAVAVLDWEMAGLGPAEADLAWWLTFDRIHTIGRGLARLPGFPPEDELVERYEQISGHPVRSLPFYLVWAALRATVLLFRFHDMLVRTGMAPDEERAAYQPALRVLDDLLEAVA